MLRYKNTIEFTVPIELDNGNSGRTKHFGASAKRRIEYEQTLRVYLRSIRFEVETPDFRQKIILTRILGARQSFYDPDSLLRGNAKELIDSLVAVGFFRDDSYKWIDSVTALQDDTRRKDGRQTIIRIERV